MNDLTIKQNTQIKETNVPASTITKLVLLSKSGTDMELVGWIGILGGIKKSEKDYMDQHYGNNGELLEWLTIDAPKIYLDFEDPAVETIMMSVASSDGVGVTVEDAAALLNNLFPSFANNTNITSFNELKEFTNVNTIVSNFNGCTNLTSIDLSNILYIGNLAFTNSGISGVINLPKFIKFNYSYPMQPFNNCNSITEINFGPYIDVANGISTDLTLTNLTNLTKVTGLSNITNIGKGTFSGDINLEYIDLDFSKLSVLNNALFKDCKKLFTNLDLSQTNITEIGNLCFYGCTSLLSITLPNTLTTIVNDCFQNCGSLTTVTGLSNITSITSCVFKECSSLATVDIDWTKITSIGELAFRKTSSLAISNLSIPNLTSLGNDAFRESGIISISNLGSITELPQHCFQNTSSLVSVTLPNTITKIWYDVFASSSISTINIPSSVTSLYKECFYGCSNLNGTFDLLNVTLIESLAFKNCNNVIISNFPRATTYSMYCFLGIKNTSITIPKEVVTIENGAFQNCANLETVSFEANSNLTTIGINAFTNSPMLTSISYPEGVTTLRRDTVSNSRNLLFIELPSTVTTINERLVLYNDSLQSITCKAIMPPQASSELFSYINSTCVIYVPASSVSAYQSATGWSSVASRIQAIPTS